MFFVGFLEINSHRERKSVRESHWATVKNSFQVKQSNKKSKILMSNAFIGLFLTLEFEIKSKKPDGK